MATKNIANEVKKNIVSRLLPLPNIRDILCIYKLKAMRQLSQNFLLSENLNNRIVKCCGKRLYQTEVCEIGPGPGNITRSLLSKGTERIIVIEKDRRFLPTLEMLKEAVEPRPFQIIMGDALHYNMEGLFSESKKQPWLSRCPDIQLIGNLPFSVATPLIIRWLEDISQKRNAWSYGRVQMTLTFQHEVAERMMAPVMTRQRSRISVMCQNWCEVDYRFTIPGRKFKPKPDVDVGVVHFTPRAEPIIPLPFKLVEKVVTCLFMNRRKYSNNNLKNLFPPSNREDLVKELYVRAELPQTLRPFQLSVEEIGRLCDAYKQIVDREPNLYKYRHYETIPSNLWLRKEEEEAISKANWEQNKLEDVFY